ncbi:MAG: methylated-DNA--[protein]-cysteine S-methyltransferase [Rhodoferax sp.]|nr:methylated-DNA--[protein]-cysteine S-methyltransferase [Rhodoferax sp.]
MPLTLPATARLSHWGSPLGPMVLAGHDAGLLGIWFEQQKHYPALDGLPIDSHPTTREAQAQLAAYFAGERTHFALTLDLSTGTAFQQSVWQALMAIPCGLTISYAALSQQIGKPSAVRAVAAAVGRNPVSIVLPCHRVVGSNGSLTGYAGGLERKAALLNLEQRKP